MLNAALALQFSDQIEDFLGLRPSEQEQERLREQIPRISAVERR